MTVTTTEDKKDFWRILLSIVLPPIGVAMQEGITKQFWINVLLTLLGYVPGIIHAVYIITKRNP
ncbi:MAG: YqaE/Pmp3 family membrane protein [Micavibrio sp.]|nr:YqaE/Pmp3 family membrane protein [Micavibrio sp.]|tara:strand:+ start:72 stop:263 length:192 start_codon:yes stop_codon:yes gene_type:complete